MIAHSCLKIHNQC